MKHDRQQAPESSEHRHWDELELFEFASRSDAPPARCEACALRLAQLRAGLARLRALGSGEDARDAALTERILALTVGESLDWRGDLRLVVGFARERLRASPWLRLAAALLVFHAAVLPVLAWIVLRAEPAGPHFFSALEPLPRESAFAEAKAEASLPLEGSPDVEPRLMEVSAGDEAPATRWQAAREREARELRDFDWPEASAALAPSDAFSLRLWARSRQALHGEDPPAAWEQERVRLDPAAVDARRLALLALELELELDRAVRAGTSDRAPQRAADLAHVVAACVAAGSPDAAVAPASELAQLALARAARLGAGPQASAAGKRSALFNPEWFEALERAAPAASEREVRAWLARAAPK